MIYDKKKLMDKQKVYLYKLVNGKIVELEGYIYPNPKYSPSVSSTTFREIDDEGNVNFRMTVSREEGIVRYNAVWFKEPNNELNALLAIKENTLNKLNNLNEKIKKVEKEIITIDSLISLEETKNKG